MDVALKSPWLSHSSNALNTWPWCFPTSFVYEQIHSASTKRWHAQLISIRQLTRKYMALNGIFIASKLTSPRQNMYMLTHLIKYYYYLLLTCVYTEAMLNMKEAVIKHLLCSNVFFFFNYILKTNLRQLRKRKKMKS